MGGTVHDVIVLLRRSFGCACCAAAVLAGGCATIDSTTADAAKHGGVTYFLPKRLLKVSVTPKVEDLKKLLAAHAEATTALAAATTGVATATAAVAKVEAQLAKAKPPATDSLLVAKAIADADLEVAKALQVKAKASLEDATLAISRTVAGHCEFDAKVELLPAQADLSKRYVARLAHNPMRDDEASLTVSAAGLLTNGKATATDRTGDIIAELAGASVADRSAPMTESVAVPQPDCKRSMVLVFDPVGDGVATTGWPGIVSANTALVDFNLKLDAGTRPAAGTDMNAARHGALYYRAVAPVVISLRRAGDNKLIDSSVVNIPQVGPVAFLPMKSSAFVKTVDEVEFTDGSVSSWKTNRPSEVLEIVRLPVKIAKSIIEVPASLVKLRVDYSSQETALAQNQAKQIQAAENLRLLKECVQAAEDAGAPSASCF